MKNFELIDTHCHVHFKAYDQDMHEVIKRSLDEGIGMIVVGTQADTSKKAIEVAEQYEGVWAAVGLHPSHLHKQTFQDEQELDPVHTRTEVFDPCYYKQLASDPKVVAIGECGFDYYHKPKEIPTSQVLKDQKQAAQDQIDLATELNKPIIIHCRDAHKNQFALLKQAVKQGKLPKKGVIHCYTGTLEQAHTYIELGFMISFTGILTFSKELQTVAKSVPLSSIMVETDAPYLSPNPQRGKRNEPAHVRYIAQTLAKIKGIKYDEVAKITTQNAIDFFHLQ